VPSAARSVPASVGSVVRTWISAPPVNSTLYRTPRAASRMSPGTTNAAVAMYAQRRSPMMLYCFRASSPNVRILMDSSLGRRSSQIIMNVRVTNTAEIIEAPSPMSSVTAKPWTESVPTRYRISAVSAVVTFESMIALIACLKPRSTAARTVAPAACSSRIRSKISTFASTAMPIESAKPASPASVSVKPKTASPPSANST
jgi:hypothetical protein